MTIELSFSAVRPICFSSCSAEAFKFTYSGSDNERLRIPQIAKLPLLSFF